MPAERPPQVYKSLLLQNDNYILDTVWLLSMCCLSVPEIVPIKVRQRGPSYIKGIATGTLNFRMPTKVFYEVLNFYKETQLLRGAVCETIRELCTIAPHHSWDAQMALSDAQILPDVVLTIALDHSNDEVNCSVLTRCRSRHANYDG
ncbi:hypothetical protein HK104_006768 [Borealophlyctis nickersoniae]|nr:hypothetical protein HK104_006768 [Borealophlyctis nickersoniae]